MIKFAIWAIYIDKNINSRNLRSNACAKKPTPK